MTTATHTATATDTSLRSILTVAFFGVALLFAASMAGSETIHNAAHDVRHAAGFPCH